MRGKFNQIIRGIGLEYQRIVLRLLILIVDYGADNRLVASLYLLKALEPHAHSIFARNQQGFLPTLWFPTLGSW